MIGVILVELLCYFFVPSLRQPSIFDWNRRIMFFDGRGTILENHGDIFTYLPHNDVRHLAIYYSDDDFVVEYDYWLHTNNYGLVQDTDVVPSRPSILLLGDSYTEGQGAEPWFRILASRTHALNYQLINGGLAGTGFEQWGKLERYLTSEGLQINKLLVLFISDDYWRLVWNLAPPLLDCLESLSSCQLDKSLYYRLPPATELPAWVGRIRALRTPPQTLGAALERRARGLLAASYHVYDYLQAQRKRLFKQRPQTAEPAGYWILARAEEHSGATIRYLIEKYGKGNVAFVHLPQKDEMRAPIELGLRARQAIKEAGGRLYDGFELCGLTPADFHVHDGHPNSRGYGKIASCVEDVLRQIAVGG